MAFLPPSTFPLYLRFYEHGHAVTFIRQRLMSRSAVKYYLTIRPLFFPPFSPLLPSPNERRLRLCFLIQIRITEIGSNTDRILLLSIGFVRQTSFSSSSSFPSLQQRKLFLPRHRLEEFRHIEVKDSS